MKNVASLTNQPFMNNADKSIKVLIAASEQEKLRIYRLRYQIYVEEMGRELPSADHKNRLVFDEFDEKGFLVYAQSGSEVIGTVRLNIGTTGEFSPQLVRMFHMDVFQEFSNGQHKQKLGFSSKYLVDSAYRRSQAAYLVGVQLYEIYRSEEVQFCFAGCNPYMIPLYERIGFRRFADNFDIPEYGCMVPLVWILEDESHMRTVCSPFLRNARRHRNNPAAANWFLKEFPTASRFINSRLINEDELWLILKQKLGQSPLLVISVLTGLTETEAKKFVHIGIIHMYKKGDQIIAPDDLCHEMNILLLGRLEVNNPALGNPNDTVIISPGCLFGRVALSKIEKQIVHVVAVTEVEYLVISGMAFETFSHQHPTVASKIMNNICNLVD